MFWAKKKVFRGFVFFQNIIQIRMATYHLHEWPQHWTPLMMMPPPHISFSLFLIIFEYFFFKNMHYHNWPRIRITPKRHERWDQLPYTNSKEMKCSFKTTWFHMLASPTALANMPSCHLPTYYSHSLPYLNFFTLQIFSDAPIPSYPTQKREKKNFPPSIYTFISMDSSSRGPSCSLTFNSTLPLFLFLLFPLFVII